MSTDSSSQAHPLATPTLNLARWHGVPRWCGNARPGTGQDNGSVMNYAGRETTPDQQRIEDALATRVFEEARMLHVGVGNSSLARRYAHRVEGIVGLTLSHDEHQHAQTLGIANYEVLMINKYSPELATIPGTFDFIIDNNPASFGCCVGHFQFLLETYCDLLRPGGLLVTDQAGLDWCYGDGPMKLDFDDLETLSGQYPFEAQRLSDKVFALERSTAAPGG